MEVGARTPEPSAQESEAAKITAETDTPNAAAAVTSVPKQRFAPAFEGVPLIHVNQLGYKPGGVKVIRYVGDEPGFLVLDESGAVCYEGTWSEAKRNAATRQGVRTADISAFTTPGIYKIVSGGAESYPFYIAEDVFADAANAVLRMFWYARCGEALPEDEAGIWAHPACHTALAAVYGTEETVDVSGGWHDAGDYNRYVSAAATAVADLLLAHELFGVPGVLAEARVELEWMLKMQSAGGGLYHKVTAQYFGKLDERPDMDEAALYVTQLSPVATAGAAACFALAARLYKGADAGFAARCLDAALAAYAWLAANPDYPLVTENPEGIHTGEYADWSIADEMFWAAAELYKTTGEARFHEALKAMPVQGGFGWWEVGCFGVVSYVTLADNMRDAGLYDACTQRLHADAESVYKATAADRYGLSLGTNYYWGSNMTVANNANLLLLSHRLKPNEAYERAALAHLDYLLGCNALSQCYISGFGTVSVEKPHHRPSAYAGAAVPGMVAGGPNMELQDADAQRLLAGMAPALCYVDTEGSYSTNEVTIYWNAPVLLLLAYFNR